MAKKREQRIYAWPCGSSGIIVRIGQSDDGRYSIVRRPSCMPFLIDTAKWNTLPINVATLPAP